MFNYAYERMVNWAVSIMAEKKNETMEIIGDSIIIHYGSYSVLLPFNEKYILNTTTLDVNGRKLKWLPGVCPTLIPKDLGFKEATKITEDGESIALELDQPLEFCDGEITLSF
jgi:hypothetical protein